MNELDITTASAGASGGVGSVDHLRGRDAVDSVDCGDGIGHSGLDGRRQSHSTTSDPNIALFVLSKFKLILILKMNFT